MNDREIQAYRAGALDMRRKCETVLTRLFVRLHTDQRPGGVLLGEVLSRIKLLDTEFLNPPPGAIDE